MDRVIGNKQKSPVADRDREAFRLSSHAVALVGQLRSNRLDEDVYGNIFACIGELEKIAGPLPQILARLESIRAGLSGTGPASKQNSYNELDALKADLRCISDELRDSVVSDSDTIAISHIQEAMREKSRLLFLGEENTASEYIRWLVNAGMEVDHIHNPAELKQALHKSSPAAVIIDLSGDTGELEKLEQVVSVIGRPPSVRVIFISNRADQEVRLRAVQAGGNAFLVRPLTPQALLQQLDPALLSGRHEYRLLLIGNMPPSKTDLAERLEHEGMIVRHLANPSQALLSVINFSPDLLIVAPQLHECRGEELGRVMHQLADYEDLPVVLIAEAGQKPGKAQLDPASEWLCPDSMDTRELVRHFSNLIGAARLRRNRQLYLHTFDPVTGLLNRHGFFNALERSIAEDNLVALVLLDLGDILHQYAELPPFALHELVEMVAGLLIRLAEPAQLAGHIGDAVFAFLVSRNSREDISKLGRLLSHSIATRFFHVGENSLTLGCDVGIAISRSSLDNGMPLYQLALKACEEARHAGINRVCIRSLEVAGGNGRGEEERRILDLLKDAGSSDRFRLVFQPIVSLRGDAVEKYEVLLRLLDTDNAFVFPSRFVPVAEQYGLMQTIDRWVVERTIRTLKKRGGGARFFNKVASSTLRDDDFLVFVEECLGEYGVEGEQLVFEISKSNLIAGISYAAAFASGVAELGCGVSVELPDINHDIGHLLENLPAGYLKLDGSMVMDLCDDSVKQARINNVIRQAEQHDIRVIATCIENANCLQVLWQSGVHYIQGNFLQEPATALDFDFGS